jgi:hypothetical protein
MLERELPHTELGEPFDIPPHHLFVINVATSHDTRGPDGQTADRFKELTQGRSRFAHQSPIESIIEVVS